MLGEECKGVLWKPYLVPLARQQAEQRRCCNTLTHACLPRTRLLSVILLMKPKDTSRGQKTIITCFLTFPSHKWTHVGKMGYENDGLMLMRVFHAVLHKRLFARLRRRVIVSQVCNWWVNMIHRAVNTFVMCNSQNHHHQPIWEVNTKSFTAGLICLSSIYYNREWTQPIRITNHKPQKVILDIDIR